MVKRARLRGTETLPSQPRRPRHCALDDAVAQFIFKRRLPAAGSRQTFLIFVKYTNKRKQASFPV